MSRSFAPKKEHAPRIGIMKTVRIDRIANSLLFHAFLAKGGRSTFGDNCHALFREVQAKL